MAHPRRKRAVVLAVIAVVLIAVTGLIEWDLGLFTGSSNHQGHVYLHILDHPVLAVWTAFALLAAAGHYAISGRTARIAAGVLAGLVAVPMVLFGLVMFAFSDFGQAPARTVASSAEYEVVQYSNSGFFGPGDIVFHVQTRAGLASYEGGADLACFVNENSGAGPEWLFSSASLTGPHTVRFTARDGANWDVEFDPKTLLPLNPVDRCTDAPAPDSAD